VSSRKGQGSAEDADPKEAPSETAPLPRAAEQFAREDFRETPLPELEDDHKRRFHEAWVKEHETHAKQADDDREMRKGIAEKVFRAIRVQVVIADAVFITYGFWNHWDIPSSTISAWLAAAVVQVIAVGLVIIRSLFPEASGKRSN
jgi:hypothetical protein